MKQTKSLELLNRLVDAIEDERENVVRAQRELRESQAELLSVEAELESKQKEYAKLKEEEQAKSLELDEWIVARNEAKGLSLREKFSLDRVIRNARKEHEYACELAEEARLELKEFELEVIMQRNQKAGYSKEFYGHMMELNEYVSKLNSAIKVVNEHQKTQLSQVNFIELFDRTETNKLLIKTNRCLKTYTQSADGSICAVSESTDSIMNTCFGEEYM